MIWKRGNVDASKRQRPAVTDDHGYFMNGDVSHEAPDFTRRIMGRLGYMRVSATVARRHRIRRWISRAALALAAGVAVSIGLHVHEGSSAVRRTAEVTLPAAIGQDFRHQQQRVGEVIRTFRLLTTPSAAPVVPANDGEHDVPDFDEDGFIPDVLPSPLPFRWA